MKTKKIKPPIRRGKANGMWKGKGAGYFALHQWINYNYGRAKTCKFCGKSGFGEKGRWLVQWALLRGKKYTRNIKNYIELCSSCHHKYDLPENFSELQRQRELKRRANLTPLIKRKKKT